MKKANTTKKAQAQQQEEVQIVTTAEILAEEAAEVAANAAADAAEIFEDLTDDEIVAEAEDTAEETAAVVDKKAARAEKRAERKAARAEKREERKAAKALRPSSKERRAARKAEFEALPLTQKEAVKNARTSRRVLVGTAVFGLAAIGGLTALTVVAAASKKRDGVNVDVDIDPATIDAGGSAGLKGSVNCGF